MPAGALCASAHWGPCLQVSSAALQTWEACLQASSAALQTVAACLQASSAGQQTWGPSDHKCLCVAGIVESWQRLRCTAMHLACSSDRCRNHVGSLDLVKLTFAPFLSSNAGILSDTCTGLATCWQAVAPCQLQSSQRQSAWLSRLHPSYCFGSVFSLLFTTAGSLLCVSPSPC